jgi:hypothetical protein
LRRPREALRRAGPPLSVGAIAAGLFGLLPSRDLTAVDGALRCVEVFYRGEIFFHENNHLLYPVYVRLWIGLLGWLGVDPEGPLEFLRLTQAMNALAAGAALAAFYVLAHAASRSRHAALLATLCLGLTRAFLLHATNSAEPMLGLTWSLLAFVCLLAGLRAERSVLLLAAGVLFALALASYQSMLLPTPAALILAALWGRPAGALLARRLAWLVGGGACGVVVIYAPAYALMGAEGPGAMLQRFLALGGAPQAFFGVSARNLLVLGLGLLASIGPFLRDDFTGLRSLAAHIDDGTLPAIGLALLVVGFLTGAAGVAARRSWGTLAPPTRLALAAGLAALVTSTAALPAWEPLYEKLWLQPLASGSLLLAVCFAQLPVTGAWRPARALVLALPAVLSLNLLSVVEAHRRETPYLRQAEALAARIAVPDLAVLEWDGISVLYRALWGFDPRRHSFDFPTQAVAHGPAVTEHLRQEVERAWRRGGRVYFVGVLDQPPEVWRVFLGGRAGVPHSALAPYRAQARRVASYAYRRGTVVLWQLEPRVSAL